MITKRVPKIKGNVAVVGQGYVGLPLAALVAKAGYKVFGIDTDQIKVDLLNQARSPVEDVPSTTLLQILESGFYRATTSYQVIGSCNVVIICVPTPLLPNGGADLSFLEKSIINVCQFIKKDSLIIVESTVAPGTTREFVVPLIAKHTSESIENYEIAYSPERIDPGNKYWNVQSTPKLVAGLSARSTHKCVEFYSRFIDKVIECDSLEVAETAKVLENSFRLVNISLINEIAMFCRKLGIDVIDVVNAASTKPHGFMPFYPSIGVGGHCIPIDPIYLIEKANQLGTPIRSISLAASINKGLPEYFVNQAAEILGGLNGKKIMVIGVAYKPNISDTRETPALSLIHGLRSQGALVVWHDELVRKWIGEDSHPLEQNYDLAIIATRHDNLNLTNLGNVPILGASLKI